MIITILVLLTSLSILRNAKFKDRHLDFYKSLKIIALVFTVVLGSIAFALALLVKTQIINFMKMVSNSLLLCSLQYVSNCEKVCFFNNGFFQNIVPIFIGVLNSSFVIGSLIFIVKYLMFSISEEEDCEEEAQAQIHGVFTIVIKIKSKLINLSVGTLYKPLP